MRRGRARVCCVCKKTKKKKKNEKLASFTPLFFSFRRAGLFSVLAFPLFPQRSFPLWYVSALLFPLEPSKTPISVQQCQKREERVAQESG